MDEKTELWRLVENFIDEQRIYCPETIYQADRVGENALCFIEDLCRIVGYFEDKKNEA